MMTISMMEGLFSTLTGSRAAKSRLQSEFRHMRDLVEKLQADMKRMERTSGGK